MCPLCATIHLSGSTITLTSCSIAVMMMLGQTPSFGKMFPFILMLGITMVAAPGVPGGAVMAALGILESMLGFDADMQGLMIALYIAPSALPATSLATALSLSSWTPSPARTRRRSRPDPARPNQTLSPDT